VSEDRLARIEDLFHAALAKPPEARAVFLAEACAGDEPLRREVSDLLAYRDFDSSFLDRPAFAAPAPPLAAGTLLGPYRIDACIGSGGMGVVYRARDTRLGRTVALKTLSSQWIDDSQRRARFEREARAVAALSHPNICALHDIGRHGDLDFLVMEYVDGEPLSAAIHRGPLTAQATAQMGSEIASALAAAHAKGVVHRDIKPANVIVMPDGHVKLVDFGLARMTEPVRDVGIPAGLVTETGVLLGTPFYMSPEQAIGQALDSRTDIFSLGVVLFECLTGRRPFDGETRSEYVRNLISGAPRPIGELRPGIPTALQRVIEQCLDPKVETRANSAQAIADALVQVAVDRAPPRSHRWRYAVVAVALLAGLWSLREWLFTRPPSADVPELEKIAGWPEVEWNSRISPDRQLVSFLSDHGGVTRIWIKKAQGDGAPRALDTPPGRIVGHTWSPDGREIAYVVVEPGGTFLRAVRSADPGPTFPAFPIEMPGSWEPALWLGDAVFLRSTSRLVRFDARARRLDDLTATWTVKPTSIDVRPDGKRVVYSAPSQSHEDLWVANLDGSGAVQLTNDAFTNRLPIWAADNAIVFASDRGGQADLWRMTLTDRALRQLTFSVDREAPESAASDGSMLTFQQTTTAADLWEIRTDSDRDRQLTVDGQGYFWPSANSRLVAYQVLKARHRGARQQMLDTDVAVGMRGESEFHLLAHGEPDGFAPRLSRDSKWLAFLRWSPQRHTGDIMLFATALGSGVPRKLADRFGFQGFTGGRPFDQKGSALVWAPAEPTLYFVAKGTAGAPEIRRFRAGTDAEPEVIVPGRPGDVVNIHLSNDGTRLAYDRWADGRVEVHVVGLASGGDRTIWSETAEKRTRQLKGWRRDDAALMVLRATANSDGTSGAELVPVRLDGTAGRPLAVGDRPYFDGARWSPSDGRLYVTTVTGLTHNVSAISIVDGRVRAVTHNNLAGVTFSGIDIVGDGTIVYSREETKQDIWRITFRQ
jgi:serine/threonine protein kinase